MYPGTALRRGDARRDLVVMVQERLGDDGWGTVAVDGDFGPQTESAVRYFQTRMGLEADGVVGPVTWGALFGVQPAVAAATRDPLVASFLHIARGEIGVRERGGRNRGARVEEYLAAVGVRPGHAWCVAFPFWCFVRASEQTGVANPMFRTAGVHWHWRNAPEAWKLPPEAPANDLRNITPGTLGHIDHGNRRGHMFIVLSADAHGISTIEGNTNPAGGREGDGVYQRTRRYSEVNLGFVDYSRRE